MSKQQFFKEPTSETTLVPTESSTLALEDEHVAAATSIKFVETTLNYKSTIQSKLDHFMTLIRKTEQSEGISARKNLIANELNHLEIWVLMYIQYGLRCDPANLSSEKSLGFLLPIAIFIKKCKEALKIRRHEDDYIHQLTDDLIKQVTPLLKNLIPTSDFQAFQRPMRSRSRSFIRLFALEEKIFTTLMTQFKQWGKILLNPSLTRHLLTLSQHLKNTYLSEETFPHTYKGLISSISYRKKIEKHYQALSEAEYKKIIIKKIQRTQKTARDSLAEIQKSVPPMSETEIRAEFDSDNPEESTIRDDVIIQCYTERQLTHTSSEMTASNLLQLMNDCTSSESDEASDETIYLRDKPDSVKPDAAEPLNRTPTEVPSSEKKLTHAEEAEDDFHEDASTSEVLDDANVTKAPPAAPSYS